MEIRSAALHDRNTVNSSEENSSRGERLTYCKQNLKARFCPVFMTENNVGGSFHIQPIVDLRSGALCGGEVLWRPAGLPPSREHLLALEDDPAVSLRVAQQSLTFALALLDKLHSEIWLSVNLSARYLGSSRSFFRPISEVFPDLDLVRRRVGRRLVIEVTERCIAGDRETNFINQLSEFHAIAIDDFGVGDVPLAHMLSLNFEKVKADRELVSGIDYDPYRQRFLQWLVAGCRAIGVKICAEGVETQSELAYLKRAGVDEGQGWFWSKAVDALSFEAMALGGSATLAAPVSDEVLPAAAAMMP